MGHSDYPGGQFLGHSFDSPQIAQWIARDRYLLLREARRQFPRIVDLDTLVRLLQPEIQDLIDLVHPFLSTTSAWLFNPDIGLPGRDPYWLLQMTDPCFEPSDLFPGEVSVPSLGILSARRPRLRLTPTGAFKQGLNWFHFHMLSLAEDMTQKSCLLVSCCRSSLFTSLEILDFSVIAYWSQLELASLIGLVHPFLELGGLFSPDDQFPGDEGLPYPRYGSKPFFHVEPVLLGEFMAVGLNAIQLGSETLPSHINAAFELLYLAGAYPVCYLPILVPEESIFHLNSYV
ncbi:hypothetical protein IW261DRAFT_1424705 [Armillaria novae-zelandiae]|uniref:Uncharacterized protein n=1 Tax=Armillaria novae-zelandiae TaxID=153914 RepID=A0AA39TWL5_9AGAR|nr:hypothetical protein IW261DRAFT_1424705 [Armillaria novae-zelandiae]